MEVSFLKVVSFCCLFGTVLCAKFGNQDGPRKRLSDDEEYFAHTTSVRFPGASKSTFVPHPTQALVREKPTHKEKQVEIPVSLFLDKNIQSVDDFMNAFVKNSDPSDLFSRSNNATTLLRSNPDGDGIFYAQGLPTVLPLSGRPRVASLSVNSAFRTEMAKPANCMARMTVVELEKPTDPAYTYLPSCTEIERCSGCCFHDQLSCQPTQIDKVNVQTTRFRYDPDTLNFQPDGLITLTLEKHVSCECRCKVKEEDCNALQHYQPNNCRCVCNNEDESDNCVEDYKFWDPQKCSCLCRNTHDCSTGFYYDMKTCSCQPDRVPNLVFRMHNNDNFPRFKGDGPAYDVIDNSRTTPKAAFRLKRDRHQEEQAQQRFAET